MTELTVPCPGGIPPGMPVPLDGERMAMEAWAAWTEENGTFAQRLNVMSWRIEEQVTYAYKKMEPAMHRMAEAFNKLAATWPG